MTKVVLMEDIFESENKNINRYPNKHQMIGDLQIWTRAKPRRVFEFVYITLTTGINTLEFSSLGLQYSPNSFEVKSFHWLTILSRRGPTSLSGAP